MGKGGNCEAALLDVSSHDVEHDGVKMVVSAARAVAVAVAVVVVEVDIGIS